MGERLNRERDSAKAHDQDAALPLDMGAEAGQTKYTNAGSIPNVMGFPHSAQGPTASERAFGALQPSKDDMQALGDRMEAERLLTSKDVTSGQDALKALEILLGQPAVVDKLSQPAFDNLLDRLSDDQRARMAPLVEASQDPKRKLVERVASPRMQPRYRRSASSCSRRATS